MKGAKTQMLIACLALYAAGRICQLFADRLPTLFVVVMHVVPPAAFALVHGSIVFGRRATLAFCGFCLGVGSTAELLSLSTGFPFGHYVFTGVMGPGPFHLPVLLTLAYVGMGYVSWVLSLLIFGESGQPISGTRMIAVSLLASFIMTAWDLSMEADWSTIDRAWIWRDGGMYFGVPLSNFLGWFGTALIYYIAFALWCRARRVAPAASPEPVWRAAVAMYVICALGNLLILRLPMAPPLVADATGKQWATMDILHAGALVSMLVMMPLALVAWLRSGQWKCRILLSELPE
jgi:uncharacterized membrane protein